MIVIRLSRGGVKNRPFYKIIAIEKSRKRSGKALDKLGFWFPSKEEFQIDKKKLDSWVKKGAQVSLAVQKLINKK